MEAARKIFEPTTRPLPKGCDVVDISDKIPSLAGCDMGLGMTMFHLIRAAFDKTRFAECIEMINRQKVSGLDGKRGKQDFRQMIRDEGFEFKGEELNEVLSSFGNPQSKNACVFAARGRNGDAWIAVYDGHPLVSSIVTGHENRYPLRGRYLQALEGVSELGSRNRVLYASRLFSLYYDTRKVEEVAWKVIDTPYNRTREETGVITLGLAAAEPGQEFGIWFNDRILVLRNNSKNVGLAPANLRTNRPTQFQHLESTLSRMFGMDISILHELRPTYCWQ